MCYLFEFFPPYDRMINYKHFGRERFHRGPFGRAHFYWTLLPATSKNKTYNQFNKRLKSIIALMKQIVPNKNKLLGG